MTLKLFAILFVTSVLLSACNQPANQGGTDVDMTESSTATTGNIVDQTLTDAEGNELDMSFDNSRGVVVITFAGETAELPSQRPASGIWYANEQYELRGKGNDIQLKKDGEVVFDHEEDIVQTQAENDNGDVLNMTFNNTAGTVKAYLNGGEQIDLTQKRAASGIWYTNDQYELRGKGESYTLTKDGTTVFEN